MAKQWTSVSHSSRGQTSEMGVLGEPLPRCADGRLLAVSSSVSPNSHPYRGSTLMVCSPSKCPVPQQHHTKGWASTCELGGRNSQQEPRSRGPEPTPHLEPGWMLSRPPAALAAVGGGELSARLQAHSNGASAGAGAAARRGRSLGQGQPSGMQHRPSPQGRPSARRLWWRMWRWPQPPAATQPRASCPGPASGAWDMWGA